MKFTFRTEAGAVTIEAGAGFVLFNGGRLMPHECVLIADTLAEAAGSADAAARRTVDDFAQHRAEIVRDAKAERAEASAREALADEIDARVCKLAAMGAARNPAAFVVGQALGA